MEAHYVARVLDLTDPASQHLQGMDLEEARRRVNSGDPEAVLGIPGSFALAVRDGQLVRLARSLDRPLRYFLAKEASGPMLLVSDRIDSLAAKLSELGHSEQFHPSYTRMVPAHHVTTLRLVGCPDPTPVHRRFLDPPRAVLPTDLDVIGEHYANALLQEVRTWLQAQDSEAPLGVLFSGGIDSTAVLLALYHQLLELGHSPSRLKAFTLAVDSGGADAEQARQALQRLDLEMLGEVIDVPARAIDALGAVALIEDYKPLDVECAAVAQALLEGIRERYPQWSLVVDGDGGDENLKDYPIEDNAELTIRSVVSNPMLYQEGWGVDAVKHSQTYSGGYSRGCVRTYAPASRLGFQSFSPFTRPALVRVAEAIPFDRLSAGDHERLYALKGEILRRGLLRTIGLELPVFPKRRFQDGAVPEHMAAEWTHRSASAARHRYRRHFLSLHTS